MENLDDSSIQLYPQVDIEENEQEGQEESFETKNSLDEQEEDRSEQLSKFIAKIATLSESRQVARFPQTFTSLLMGEKPLETQTLCFLSAIEFLLLKPNTRKLLFPTIRHLRIHEYKLLSHIFKELLNLHYNTTSFYAPYQATSQEYALLSANRVSMPEYLISELLCAYAEEDKPSEAVDLYQDLASFDINHIPIKSNRKKLASSIIDYIRKKLTLFSQNNNNKQNQPLSNLSSLLRNNLDYLWNKELQRKTPPQKQDSPDKFIGAEELSFLSENVTQGLSSFLTSKEYVFRNNRFEKYLLSLKIISVSIFLFFATWFGISFQGSFSATFYIIMGLVIAAYFIMRYWLVINKPINTLDALESSNTLILEQLPLLTYRQLNDLFNKQLFSNTNPKEIAILPVYAKQLFTSLSFPLEHIKKEEFITMLNDLQKRAKRHQILNI